MVMDQTLEDVIMSHELFPSCKEIKFSFLSSLFCEFTWLLDTLKHSGMVCQYAIVYATMQIISLSINSCLPMKNQNLTSSKMIWYYVIMITVLLVTRGPFQMEAETDIVLAHLRILEAAFLSPASCVLWKHSWPLPISSVCIILFHKSPSTTWFIVSTAILWALQYCELFLTVSNLYGVGRSWGWVAWTNHASAMILADHYHHIIILHNWAASRLQVSMSFRTLKKWQGRSQTRNANTDLSLSIHSENTW